MEHPQETLRFGPYELDLGAPELRQQGRTIDLQRKPMEVLIYLALNRRRIVSSDELLQTVWRGVSVCPGVITSAIKTLRATLGDSGKQQHVIRTRHRYGYQFIAEVEQPEAAPQPVSPDEPELSQSGWRPDSDAGDEVSELAARLAHQLLPVLVQLCVLELDRALEPHRTRNADLLDQIRLGVMRRMTQVPAV